MIYRNWVHLHLLLKIDVIFINRLTIAILQNKLYCDERARAKHVFIGVNLAEQIHVSTYVAAVHG